MEEEEEEEGGGDDGDDHDGDGDGDVTHGDGDGNGNGNGNGNGDGNGNGNGNGDGDGDGNGDGDGDGDIPDEEGGICVDKTMIAVNVNLTKFGLRVLCYRRYLAAVSQVDTNKDELSVLKTRPPAEVDSQSNREF
jgi:hypothetical protein